jgi:hypothetical protein
MSINVTQQSVYVAGLTDPDPRLLGQSLEILGTSKSGLQVSQFNVDVAGSISGDLHLGRIYLEVLQEALDAIEVSASSVLVLRSYDSSGQTSELELDSIVDVVHKRLNHHITTSIDVVSLPNTSLFKELFQVIQFVYLGGVSEYVGPISASAASLLLMSCEVYKPIVILQSCVSSLNFTETVARHGTLNTSIAHEIQIDAISDLTIKLRSAITQIDLVSTVYVDHLKIVGNILGLEQSARKDLFFESVTSELSLDQNNWINPITIGPGSRDRVSLPQQVVGLVQTIRSNIQSYALENILEIDSTPGVVGPIYAAAVSITQWTEEVYGQYGDLQTVYFGLQDSATVIVDPRRQARTQVGLEQLAQKVRLKAAAISLSAASILEISTDIPTITYLDVVNELDLETAADTKAAFSVDAIDFSSQVTYNINFAPRLATSQLDIVSSFFAVPQHFSLCPYSPFVGSTTDPAAPQNILKNQPVIDPTRRGVTFFYPWSSPTTTLDLRGPDFGNRNRLEFQRINRETRGGTLIIWADPIWPKNERLVLNFAGLTEAEGQSALDFIALSLGKEIGFTDWEGNTVHGVIMTPSEPLVRDGRHSLSLGLEIEIAHSVIVGTCISDLLVSNLSYQNRNRAFNVESSIDFELVSEYN